MRFLLEIARAIRKAVGPDYVIGIRISRQHRRGQPA